MQVCVCVCARLHVSVDCWGMDIEVCFFFFFVGLKSSTVLC